MSGTRPGEVSVAPGLAAELPVRLRRPSPTAQVVMLTLFGAVLRFATLNVQSIERDEAATLVLVHRGFAHMLSHLPTAESAPPLYYILVWAWTKVVGSGPLGFRSFSALVGTLTIPAMYAAGRQISPRVGVWAAALASVSPMMYFYSQQARDYELMVLFSAAAFAFWLRALEQPGKRPLALWAGMSALAVLTHYFAAFLFVPEALILVRRLGWRRVWPAVGVVVLVGLALVPLAVSQRTTGSTNWIGETAVTTRLAMTIKEFLVGSGPMEDLRAFLAGLLALGAVALLLRRGDERERRIALDTAVVAVVAVVLPLLLAGTHSLDVFNSRNVIAVWIPCALLVALGLGAARAGRTGTLLGAGLCAISLLMIVSTNALPSYQRENWRGVAKVLDNPAAARVLVTEQYAALPLSIYMGPLRMLSAPVISTRELDLVELHTRHVTDSPLLDSGFRPAGVTKTETFAISRFAASKPTTVSVESLRRMTDEPKAEIVLQR